MAVGAAVDFDQAVEDGVAGEPRAGRVFDVDIVLAVGLAVVEDEVGEGRGQSRAQVQRVAGGVEAAVQGLEFGFDGLRGWLTSMRSSSRGGGRMCAAQAASRRRGRLCNTRCRPGSGGGC